MGLYDRHADGGFGETEPGKLHDIRNEAAPNVPFFTPVQDPPAGSAVDPQPDGRPIPTLFKPLKIRGMQMQNRMVVSPMCQYSAHEGFQTPWHTTHLGGIVQRGPGLTILEVASVQPNGRISPEDAGLWLDAHVAGLKQHVDFAHSQGQKIGIQVGHAGRKASTIAPFLSGSVLATKQVGGWPDDVVGPSAIPYDHGYAKPRELTIPEIVQFKEDYISAVRRVVLAGFDVIEIHGAHGYLLSSFLSPSSNHRSDEYGGSFDNRVRLMLELVEEVRAVIPNDMPLFVRISATEWLEDAPGYEGESWTLSDSIKLAHLLADRGVDLLDVSTAGNHPLQKVKGGPGYQAPFAMAIKKAVGDKMLVSAVGTITSGKQAEDLLNNDTPVDLIMVGRMFQKDPALVWSWAEELGTSIHVAKQIGWGFGGRKSKPRKAETAAFWAES